MSEKTGKKIHSISVIVPESPFAPDELRSNKPYLCAIKVEKIMDWWPGKPYYPYFNVDKVRSIQRSLDWKRVAQIAAYLLQEEIVDAPEKLVKYFDKIYKPKKNEPGREWPPKVSRVIGFEKSEYPVFSSVLLHVNGATFGKTKYPHIAQLTFDESKSDLDLTVIDGQHRINGGYFALMLLREKNPKARWDKFHSHVDSIDLSPKRVDLIDISEKRVDSFYLRLFLKRHRRVSD